MNKIMYLRVMINDACNLNCFFCHKEGENEFKRTAINIDVEDSFLVLQILIELGIKKIKFLGGEPTLTKELPELISKLKDNYDVDISLVSNGVVVKDIWDKYINAGIDRINISLHGLVPDVFKKITGGNINQLEKTISSIKYLNQKSVLGKINYVILKNTNEDEFYQVLDFIHSNNIVLDVLNYLGTNPKDIDKFYYTFDEIIELIEKKYKIIRTYEYENKYSLPSKRFDLEGGGVINLKVNKLNKAGFLKFCEICPKRDICVEGIKAIRLTSNGYIKPCLFRTDNMFDIKHMYHEYGKDYTKKIVKKYLETL